MQVMCSARGPDLPGHPGFRPASHGAMELDVLLFPDSVGTRLDDKLGSMQKFILIQLFAERLSLF